MGFGIRGLSQSHCTCFIPGLSDSGRVSEVGESSVTLSSLLEPASSPSCDGFPFGRGCQARRASLSGRGICRPPFAAASRRIPPLGHPIPRTGPPSKPWSCLNVKFRCRARHAHGRTDWRESSTAHISSGPDVTTKLHCLGAFE
jgi:hypothetical protein